MFFWNSCVTSNTTDWTNFLYFCWKDTKAKKQLFLIATLLTSHFAQLAKLAKCTACFHDFSRLLKELEITPKAQTKLALNFYYLLHPEDSSYDFSFVLFKGMCPIGHWLPKLARTSIILCPSHRTCAQLSSKNPWRSERRRSWVTCRLLPYRGISTPSEEENLVLSFLAALYLLTLMMKV